jgi:hypothetical protein
MTESQLSQFKDLIEAAHFAPDDDAYLAIVVDNLLALREEQRKQTALLEALVDTSSQMLKLVSALAQNPVRPKLKSGEKTRRPDRGGRPSRRVPIPSKEEFNPAAS